MLESHRHTALICLALLGSLASGCSGGGLVPSNPTAANSSSTSASPGSSPALGKPVTLARPVYLRPVTEVTPCGPSVGGTPDDEKQSCYTLSDGIVLHEVLKLQAARDAAINDVAITIELGPADAKAFGVLTSKLVAQPSPRNQLAVVVDNVVITAPAIQAAITGNQVQIVGGFSMASAEKLVRKLTG